MKKVYAARRLAILALAFLPGAATALAPYDATYKLSRGTVAIGETRYELRMDDGDVLFRAHAKTTGLIKLIRNDEITEESHLRLDEQGRLTALAYEYRHERGRRVEEEQHIHFDWDKGVAVSRVDGQSYELPLAPGTIDRMALQLRVMQDAMAGTEAECMVYQAVDKDELRQYQFTLEGEHRLTTGAGEFATLRYQREHGSRTTIFWVAPELGYLPVRVEQRREDRATIRLDLESVSGALVEHRSGE